MRRRKKSNEWNALRQISFRAHMLAHHTRWTNLSAMEHRFDDEIHLSLSVVCLCRFRFFFFWLGDGDNGSDASERVRVIVLQIQRYDGDAGCRLSPVQFCYNVQFMTVFDFIFKFSLSILLSPRSSIVRYVVTDMRRIELWSLNHIKMRQPKEISIFWIDRFLFISM